MKHLFYSLMVVVLFGVLISCEKKNEEGNVDYRDNYVGQWKFKVEMMSFNINDTSAYSRDTITYNGEIKYGNIKNEVLIEYTSTKSIVLELSENGVLSNFPTHYSNGEFMTYDSLELNLRWGGNGGGTWHWIDGIKE